MTTPGSINRMIRVTMGQVVLEDVVMVIDIQKTLDVDPNESRVMFRNLSLETEARFRRGAFVTVEVGQDHLQHVFAGTIVRFGKEFKRPDTEFSIWMKRERVERSEYITENFPDGTPYTFIVSKLARGIGLPLGDYSAVPNKLVRGNYPVQGYADSAMTGFLSKLGLTWHVDEGLINIVSVRSSNPMHAKRLINGQNGMIGSPKRTDTGADVKVLVDTPVSLNQLVEVESSNYVYGFEENSPVILDTRGRQTYKVFGMRYRGDNWDGEFTNTLRLETIIGSVEDMDDDPTVLIPTAAVVPLG